jgi:Methyltransferase domain
LSHDRTTMNKSNNNNNNNNRNTNRLTILLLRRIIILICMLFAGITQYSLLFRKLQFTLDILSNGIHQWTPPVSFGFVSTQGVTSQPNSFPMNDQSFQRAYEESLGFFQDVTEEEWLRRKKISLAQIHMVLPQPEQLSNVSVVTKIENAPYWYATNWHPDFHCGYEDFIGLGGDGGKWVCDPHRLLQKERCIIYSIGSNGKFDFEISVNQQLPNCEVHIFDFTDYSEAMRTANVNASYHTWGLGSSSGKANVRSNKHRIFKPFRQTVQELGHTGRTIDIFKIDCEGCEVRITTKSSSFPFPRFLLWFLISS